MDKKSRLALEMACGWLEGHGDCKYQLINYECKKDKNRKGVCTKCLAAHFRAMAKAVVENEGETF